jgi:hypothetical protein
MDFEVGGHKYQSGKMDAFAQLHVMRKLAPVFAAMGSLSSVAAAFSAPGEKDGGEAAGKTLSLLAEAVSSMSEEDFNSVLSKCCAVTSRKVGEAGYAPLWDAGAGRLMYSGITGLDLLQIVAAVISDNLGNFSGAPLSPPRG